MICFVIGCRATSPEQVEIQTTIGSICCGFYCTACCTTNPQLIEQVEFGLVSKLQPLMYDTSWNKKKMRHVLP